MFKMGTRTELNNNKDKQIQDNCMNPAKCPWCGSDPLYVKYHDEEWYGGQNEAYVEVGA